MKAGINFRIDEITYSYATENSVNDVLANKETQFRKNLDFLKDYNPDKLNVYFVRNPSVNGIAYFEERIALISDNVPYSHRTVAHELGHLLGLNHVNDPNRLMYEFSGNEEITAEEIAIVRNNAGNF